MMVLGSEGLRSHRKEEYLWVGLVPVQRDPRELSDPISAMWGYKKLTVYNTDVGRCSHIGLFRLQNFETSNIGG